MLFHYIGICICIRICICIFFVFVQPPAGASGLKLFFLFTVAITFSAGTAVHPPAWQQYRALKFLPYALKLLIHSHAGSAHR